MTGIEIPKYKYGQMVNGLNIGQVFTITDEDDTFYFTPHDAAIYKSDVAIVGLTDSPFAALSSIPVEEGEKEAKLERLLRNEIHKNLSVIDIGMGEKNDFIIGGIDQLVKSMLNYLSDYTSTSSPYKDPIDAGKLFDENADCYNVFKKPAPEGQKGLVINGDVLPAMSREKFIEVFDKFRKPDVGELEKKDDHLRELFEEYKEMITRYCIAIANVDIRKDDESYFFDCDLKKCVYVRAGDFNSDHVAEELENFEFDGIDKEGIWQIEVLFKYFPGDSEEPSFMELLYQEAIFCGTFEERDQHERDMQDLTLPDF